MAYSVGIKYVNHLSDKNGKAFVYSLLTIESQSHLYASYSVTWIPNILTHQICISQFHLNDKYQVNLTVMNSFSVHLVKYHYEEWISPSKMEVLRIIEGSTRCHDCITTEK